MVNRYTCTVIQNVIKLRKTTSFILLWYVWAWKDSVTLQLVESFVTASGTMEHEI